MEQRSHLISIFLQKNSQINLSAIRDEEGVFVKHIQDSLELTTIFQFPDGAQVADIGTWGWFPLMPLAITFPKVQFTGIDSVRKKTIAVNEMLADLHVSNAKVVRTRIEDYPKESFDFITARAVAYIDKLLWRAYPLLKKWGQFIFWKQKSEEEQQVLEKCLKKYKINLIATHEYQLFEGDIERVIYFLQK